MDKLMIREQSLGCGAAVLVLVVEVLTAVYLIVFPLASYPSLIKDAYKDPLQIIEMPGVADIELSKKGPYGVYYESLHAPTQGPPLLDCSLVSKATGDEIPLVPDYVPTNRYSTKDGNRVGVLIYSTTIKEPSLHTLSCHYPDGRISPKLVLAIGPNYFFEFLRVAWNMGGSILGGVGVLCGSIVLSFGITVVVLIRTRKKS